MTTLGAAKASFNLHLGKRNVAVSLLGDGGRGMRWVGALSRGEVAPVPDVLSAPKGSVAAGQGKGGGNSQGSLGCGEKPVPPQEVVTAGGPLPSWSTGCPFPRARAQPAPLDRAHRKFFSLLCALIKYFYRQEGSGMEN